jgi:hypothetical protein
MTTHKLNQSGSAILLVMVLAGAIGAAIFYLTNLSTDTRKKVTDDARILSYRSVVQMVKNKFYSGKTCTTLLANKDISNAFVRKGISILPLDLKLDINKAVIKVPTLSEKWFIKGGTSIKDITLTVSEIVRYPVIRALGPPTDPQFIAAKGFIHIIPDHYGTGAGNSANKEFRIPIFLYYYQEISGISRLESCYEPDGEAFTCTASLFGAFDQNQSDPLKRCQPQRFCFHDKKTVVDTSTSCPPNYKRTPISKTKFSCDWCNTNSTLVHDDCYEGTRAKFFTEPFDPKYSDPYKDFNKLPELSSLPSLKCGYIASGGGGTTTSGGGTTSGGTTSGLVNEL